MLENRITQDHGKKSVRLYNVFLPIWTLLFLPTVWLIALPVNFVVDSVVLLLCLRHFAKKRGQTDYRPWGDWIRSIFLVWVFGFISDLLASGFLFCFGMLPVLVGGENSAFSIWWDENILVPMASNPFTNFLAVLLILIGIAVAALLIYFFCKKICLRFVDSLDSEETARTALILAICTAPYFMLVPSNWIYG